MIKVLNPNDPVTITLPDNHKCWLPDASLYPRDTHAKCNVCNMEWYVGGLFTHKWKSYDSAW